MGEYADREIDRWIGDCSWGRGPRRDRLPANPTCKKCGKVALRWRQIKGGEWRLHEKSGTIHDCRAKPSDATAFDGLTLETTK